ncbi:MAG: hypothetical protein HUJ53_07340 [Holdemanella sp.]|nr:hypothetical protein [Holdemanella sp.]
MRPLTWEEYYDEFYFWADTTREKYVSRLSNLGPHDEVADVISSITKKSVASRLANRAMDEGIRFDEYDIFMMKLCVDEATLKRMEQTQDNSEWIEEETEDNSEWIEEQTVDNSELLRNQRKKNKEDFWTGVAFTMFIDTFIEDIFGKKK